MQMSVARERSVAPDAVDGDADDLGAVLAEFRKDLVVESDLVTAHRTPVGGIENEDDGTAAKITESEDLVGRGAQRKIRCRHSGGKNRRGSFGGSRLGHCRSSGLLWIILRAFSKRQSRYSAASSSLAHSPPAPAGLQLHRQAQKLRKAFYFCRDGSV